MSGNIDQDVISNMSHMFMQEQGSALPSTDVVAPFLEATPSRAVSSVQSTLHDGVGDAHGRLKKSNISAPSSSLAKVFLIFMILSAMIAFLYVLQRNKKNKQDDDVRMEIPVDDELWQDAAEQPDADVEDPLFQRL